MAQPGDGTMAEKYLVQVDDWPCEAELERPDGDGGLARVRLHPDGEWRSVEMRHVRAGLHVVMIENHPLELYLERRGADVDVTIGRRTYRVRIGRGRAAAAMRAAAAGDGLVRVTAPMTGVVLETRVEAGAHVEAGDVLVVIESMKMNNELRAPVAGTVERVGARVDAQVGEGDELAALRPATEGDAAV